MSRISAVLVDDIAVNKEELRTYLEAREVVSVTEYPYNCDPTGVSDSTAGLQAVRDYIAGQAQPVTVVFPPGRYTYTQSPNWAISEAKIEAMGEVILRCTGTGPAVLIDSGEATQGSSMCWNLRMGRFLVEAAVGATNAIYVRAVHHSHLSFKVLGGSANGAGLLCHFAVCTKFDQLTVSGNPAGVWYASTPPKYGMVLSRRNAGEQTAYCTFDTPILEGTQIGGYFDQALGNVVIGGTMEACTQIGVQLTENSNLNKFHGTDFEVNTDHDIYDLGTANHFYGCDSYTQATWESTAKNAVIVGGEYSNISIVAGAQRLRFRDIVYNRFASTGTISDNGTHTAFRNIINGLGTLYDGRPALRVVPTVTASPYTYTNTTGDPALVIVTGGTVSQVQYTRDGVGDIVPTGTNIFIPIRGGDAVQITYSVAPTVVVRF